MRIQHNIMAINSYRGYNNTNSVLNKHQEKLASGLRINRAADDAAGLAISEKMRHQLKVLDRSVIFRRDEMQFFGGQHTTGMQP